MERAVSGLLPPFVSTIKLRQAGFTKTIDTEDSFRNALQSLIDQHCPLSLGMATGARDEVVCRRPIITGQLTGECTLSRS
jgi:hypothetical protein